MPSVDHRPVTRPHETMRNYTPTTLKKPKLCIQDGPCFHLKPKALAGLDALAKSRGIPATVALHQLLEAGTRHLVQDVARPTQVLSKKQTAVLISLKSGHSVKEIAQQIGVSEGTIRTHIHRIRSRLNLSDLLSLRFQ